MKSVEHGIDDYIFVVAPIHFSAKTVYGHSLPLCVPFEFDIDALAFCLQLILHPGNVQKIANGPAWVEIGSKLFLQPSNNRVPFPLLEGFNPIL